MDFEVTYTEEQQRFRSEVRAWLEQHVPSGITRSPVSDEDSLARYRQLRDRKSTRLNSSHIQKSRMPSSA